MKHEDDNVKKDFLDMSDVEDEDKTSVFVAEENEEEKEEQKKQSTQITEKEVDATKIYLREIGFTPLLTAKEEAKLARKVTKKDKKARRRMIESNLRLVVKIARHYRNYGLDFADLIEEGNLGLITAVEKFDPEMGFRFSTYATWWIRQNIERAIINQGKLVRIPVHVTREIRSYKRKASEILKKLERPPTLKELAAATRKPVAKVRRVLDLNQDVLSLDAPLVDGEGGSTFASQLEDENQKDPLNLVKEEDIRREIFLLLAHLLPQQRKVLIKRFGLNDEDGMSLEQIADKMHMSREKVRQIQNAALRKLRNVMIERNEIDEMQDAIRE